MSIQRLCVFCGSRQGRHSNYIQTAYQLGTTLAEQGIELVYGGAKIGVMGAVADGCLAAGGQVIGVIPEALLQWEVGHQQLTRLEVVDSMHTRKARMAALSDGFITLPGGLGTLEELFEVLTWSQLGFHQKPIALLNIENYYTSLLAWLSSAAEQGFLSENDQHRLLVATDPVQLLTQIRHYQPIESNKHLSLQAL